MAEFKVPTEEKVVREKRTKYVLFYQKNTNLTLATRHLIGPNTGTILFPRTTRYIALFLGPKALPTACNVANDSNALRYCDLERALGGDTWCLK
jgi:hypothetical protein